MKTIIILFSLVFVCFTFQGQTTYVPDQAFENYLEMIVPGASNGTPNDHYVMTTPLQSVQGLHLLNTGVSAISDLTGLEDFINLKSINFNGPFPFLDTIDLDLYNLPLESVFIDYLEVLKYVSFGNASLKFVSILHCPSIQELEFGLNQLADSVKFHIGYCDSLKQIDFSGLTFGVGSELMIVGHNQLEHVTFGQVSDTNIVEYGFHLSSNLHCIEVSNPVYFFDKLSPTQPWWPEAQHQPNLYGFSTDCSNPTLELSDVELNHMTKTEIGVFDLLGRKVQKDQSGIVLIYYSDGSFIRTYNP